MSTGRYNFVVSAILTRDLPDGATELNLRTGLYSQESESEAIGAFTVLALKENKGASLRMVTATKIPYADNP